MVGTLIDELSSHLVNLVIAVDPTGSPSVAGW